MIVWFAGGSLDLCRIFVLSDFGCRFGFYLVLVLCVAYCVVVGCVLFGCRFAWVYFDCFVVLLR